MKRPWFKICCIADPGEADLAQRLGASALGLVSQMPSGPGPIPEARITRIVASLAGTIDTVLLTSRRRAEEIVVQQRRTGASMVQICDRLEAGGHELLRASLPDVSLVQVLHVEDRKVVAEARELVGRVDALLLDSGRPSAPRPELGGTGRTHDWQLSREVRDAVDLPVVLAGGLRSENVAQAIRTVRPAGVDLCTGVRTAGKLDAAKLEAFLTEAHQAFATLDS
jgi:phosphoribosylanthranilate isomerase